MENKWKEHGATQQSNLNFIIINLPSQLVTVARSYMFWCGNNRNSIKGSAVGRITE